MLTIAKTFDCVKDICCYCLLRFLFLFLFFSLSFDKNLNSILFYVLYSNNNQGCESGYFSTASASASTPIAFASTNKKREKDR